MSLGKLTRALIFGEKTKPQTKLKPPTEQHIHGQTKPKSGDRRSPYSVDRRSPYSVDVRKNLLENIKLLMKENKKLYTELKYNEPNNEEILENIDNNKSRSTKEFLTKAIYRQINNSEGNVIPVSTEKTNSPVILALSKAKIRERDVLNINKWIGVFEHDNNEKEILQNLQKAAEENFMYWRDKKVEEGKEEGHEIGKEEGIDSVPGVIFNKKGRDEVKNNIDNFKVFPELAYLTYLNNQNVLKHNAKANWGKWIYRELFGKTRVFEKDPHWQGFKENVLTPKVNKVQASPATELDKEMHKEIEKFISPAKQLLITDDDETIIEKPKSSE